MFTAFLISALAASIGGNICLTLMYNDATARAAYWNRLYNQLLQTYADAVLQHKAHYQEGDITDVRA